MVFLLILEAKLKIDDMELTFLEERDPIELSNWKRNQTQFKFLNGGSPADLKKKARLAGMKHVQID